MEVAAPAEQAPSSLAAPLKRAESMIDRPIGASFVVLGLTTAGNVFRPSDWADRLCGVMAQFRPGTAGPQAHLSYSPYVMPGVYQGNKCVLVDGRLNQLVPMADSLVSRFGRDNDLQLLARLTPQVTPT